MIVHLATGQTAIGVDLGNTLLSLEIVPMKAKTVAARILTLLQALQFRTTRLTMILTSMWSLSPLLL